MRFYDADDNSVTTAYPDASGWYTATGFAADDYRIKFDPYGDADLYLEEYYDDKPDLESADSITVALGNVVTDVDA